MPQREESKEKGWERAEKGLIRTERERTNTTSGSIVRVTHTHTHAHTLEYTHVRTNIHTPPARKSWCSKVDWVWQVTSSPFSVDPTPPYYYNNNYSTGSRDAVTVTSAHGLPHRSEWKQPPPHLPAACRNAGSAVSCEGVKTDLEGDSRARLTAHAKLQGYVRWISSLVIIIIFKGELPSKGGKSRRVRGGR